MVAVIERYWDDILDLILTFIFGENYGKRGFRSVFFNLTDFFGEMFFISWIITIVAATLVIYNIPTQEKSLKRIFIECLTVLLGSFVYTKFGFIFIGYKGWLIFNVLFLLIVLFTHCVISFIKWYKKTEKKTRKGHLFDVLLFVVSLIVAVLVSIVFETSSGGIFFAVFIGVFIVLSLSFENDSE